MENRAYNPESQKFQWTRSEVTPSGIILPAHNDIFVASMQERGGESITFIDWKENNYSPEPGSILTDVPPAELFTTQDWLDPEKMIRAVIVQEEGAPDAFTVQGIIYTHPKPHMGRVPVVLEGNHRTVNAALHQQRVNLEIIESEISKPVWRMTNLVRKYGDMARTL